MPKAPFSNESRAMPPMYADGASFHVSTRNLPPRERLPFLREVFGRQVVRVDIEPFDDAPLDYEATLLQLPGLQVLLSGTQTPARWSRTTEFVKDGNDDLVLFLQLDGTLIRSQRGVDLNVFSGSAASFLHEEPASIQFGVAKSIALMLPRAAMSRKVRQVEDSPKRLIQDNEALSLLRSYISFLRDNIQLADPATSPLMVAHIYDLVAVAIGASNEGYEIAQGRGVRAARLRATKEFIAQHLSSHDLSAALIAVHFRLTPRYIHMLFETEGVTLSSFIGEQRLELAKNMLRSAGCERMSISAIAFASGFSDLSHFNRSFRRRFGATPSEVRAAKGQ
jgi:AraC-like DNA-binding protein